MKSKSKLSIFAALVLQALLLVPVSALAAAEADQEIGVPQAAQVEECLGAMLSPDDDRFHTVHEGLLTQYQIKPFKKLDSVAIDREPFKERQFGGRCRVLITNDKSKLIIYYSDRMFLLDARTGQILNRFERTKLASLFSIDAAVLNANELVILDQIFSEETGRSFDLTIWDADTLKLKRRIHRLTQDFGFIPDQGSNPGMLKTLDRIYLMNAISAAVLNSKTYALELTISFVKGAPMISKNFQKIYVGHVSKVTDHLTHKQTTYDEVKDGRILVFDQATRESTFKNNVSNEEYHSWLAASGQSSRNKGYVWKGDLLKNVDTGVISRFHQYESGEAILLGWDKYFQLTPGARKYLMMKNSAGKTVPINDATFAKYHRAEGMQ